MMKEFVDIDPLLRLLDDPDPEIQRVVHQQLLELGPSILPRLRSHTQSTTDAVVQQRLAEIMHVYQRQYLDDLVRLVQLHQRTSTKMDLQEAMFLLDGFGRPEADRRALSVYLDRLALRIHEIFIAQAPANDLTHILSVHAVLFEEEGFHGAIQDYYDPLNSYLSTVISRREGIPVSLAVIELLLADRVGLDIDGVAMPYHFLLFSPELDVFVDPFHAGTFISRNDCINYVERSGLTFTDSMLQPVSNVDIVVRMIRNLAFAHNRHLEIWEAQALEGALHQLAPSDPPTSHSQDPS
jgi:regulator of sirC expression with transglutaminase-like and TPR domain